MKIWGVTNLIVLLLFISVMLTGMISDPPPEEMPAEQVRQAIINIAGFLIVPLLEMMLIAWFLFKFRKNKNTYHEAIIDSEKQAVEQKSISPFYKIFAVLLALLFLAAIFGIKDYALESEKNAIRTLTPEDKKAAIFHSRLFIFSTIALINIMGFNLLSAFRKPKLNAIPERL